MNRPPLTAVSAVSAVSAFSERYLRKMPPLLAKLAAERWLAIANVKPYCAPHALQYDYSDDQADRWMMGFGKPFMWHEMPLDINASDEDVVAYAEKTAERFRYRGRCGMDVWAMLKQAEGLGLTDWRERFARQLEAGRLQAVVARLQDGQWWRRFFRRALLRRQEHILRADFNLVNRRRGLYVSDDAVRRRRQQRRRNAAIMEVVKLINELGQSFILAELVERSNANPAIRRAELMTRIAGFETIARDMGHIGEFITITCPSRFHRAHHWGGENVKYDGSSPREAQTYLQGVWAKIQAALQREEIEIYGFRVVEPHHDGCPHWHGLFFMERRHRRAFRRIVARYACRDSREELGLYYFETAKAAKEQARRIQAEQRAQTAGTAVRPQSLNTIANSLPTEAGFWANPDYRVFRSVSARVDFEAINWKRGTAAGYIAKYIAKNIDGKNAFGESVGVDFEAGGAADVVETAERVDAWAATWGIRQFQQIGGAPVSVWRELRREGMTAGDGSDTIVRAAVAADNGDWGKFTMLMGGTDCPRDLRPIRLFREDVAETNRYGEPREKVVRGVFETDTGLIKISRIHEWVVERNGGTAAAWTGVNNSTKMKSDTKTAAEPPYAGHFDSKETLRMHSWNAETVRARLERDLQELLKAKTDSPLAEAARNKEINLLQSAIADLRTPPADRQAVAGAVAAAKTQAALEREYSNGRMMLRDLIQTFDRLSPPARVGKPEPTVDLTPYRTRIRRFPAPKKHDTPESVMADIDALLHELEDELAQMADWDF